jgi:HlyD family secretion protein
MFLIKIRISVTACGIFRPEAENTLLYAPVSGKAEKILVCEGQAVCAGDTLMVMDIRRLMHNLQQCRSRKNELIVKIADARNILSGRPDKLVSPALSSAYRQFSDSYQATLAKHEKAARERDRLEQLFVDSLISEKEYDDLAHTEKILHYELDVMSSTYRSDMEGLAEQMNLEFRDILLREETLLREIGNHHFIAPVSGHIQDFSGIYAGSNIQSGQLLFTISPDTTLIAEIFLAPSQAGYVYTGQEARILVDAYNYREWGSVSSMVRDISSDVIMINNAPFYRIKCRVTDSYLSLKNGRAGRLKQGMTFRARLFMSRRTLAQILFDRLEKWMAPVPSTPPS